MACTAKASLSSKDVRGATSGAIERLPDRRHRAEPHEHRIHAGNRVRDDAGDWLPPTGRRVLFAGDHERRGAVVDARRVASGDGAILLEGRLEPGKLLDRRSGARIFVAREPDRIALLLRDADRDNLAIDPAALDRRDGAALALRRELVLPSPRDAVARGNRLCRVAHVAALDQQVRPSATIMSTASALPIQ